MTALDAARRDLGDIRAARAGDRPAGERLATRLLYVPRLLAAMNARRALGWSRHDLEDASQDVMTHVWSRLDQFRGEGSLEAWLYRFCENEVRNRSRLTRRRRGVVDAIAGRDPIAAGGPEDVEPRDLDQLLDELGPPDAPLVRLKHFEGMTFEEMSRCLGIATSTAKTRYYRGIEWLRRRFERCVDGGTGAER